MDTPPSSPVSGSIKWLILIILGGLSLLTYTLIVIYGYELFNGGEKTDCAKACSLKPTATPTKVTTRTPTSMPTATPSASVSPNRLTPTPSIRLTPTIILSPTPSSKPTTQ